MNTLFMTLKGEGKMHNVALATVCHKRAKARAFIVLMFALAGACVGDLFPQYSIMRIQDKQSSVFEVASVTPSPSSGSDAGQLAITGGRFMARNLSAKQMVYIAYGISTDDLISNLPQWTSNAQFDIQARLVDDNKHVTEEERSRTVLRALLTDRFGLKSHYEKREVRVYALTRIKESTKLQKALASDQPEMSIMRGVIHLKAATIKSFAEGISLMVGRPVIDQTELSGLYNIDLRCSPDELAATNESSPSIRTVLRDQFGLRLTPTRNSTDVLIIDQLSKPSAN